MKLIVNPHKIEIDKSPVNEREIDITKCEFEFADEITNDYVKEAYFTFNGVSYKEIIVNNQCAIPNEVLEKKGQVEIGVVAFLVENEEEIKRYNPSPAYFNTWLGSLKDNAENSEPITPSEMEQFEQALNDGLNEVANVDIDAEQLDNGMSVTITNRYGEDKTVYAYDGEKGETGATPNIQIGTVVTGDHSEVTRTGTNENPIFNFVLEKGDKGDTGNGIASVTKTSTSGLVDTYTITYTNGTTTTFNVTNGKSITNIAKTSTSGLEDTYTITYNDNTTSTFTVTNGNGISSIEKTGTQDNVDTYTIYYTNGTTSTFTVTNSTVTNQEFEELKAEHEELVNTLPRVEGTGESITLDNTAQYKMNVALSGNTSQTTYTGKNLFNKANITTEKRLDQSGKITSAEGYFTSDFIAIIANTQYTKNSPTIDAYHRVCFYTSNDQTTYISRVDNSNTFTTPENATYLRFCGILTEVDTTQLETGSTATSYEPYVGGIPSPNPLYPQPIKKVTGNNSITVCGKNLLNIEETIGSAGITTTLNNDMSITISGTATNTNVNIVDWANSNLPIGTYIFSIDHSTQAFNTRLRIGYEDGTYNDIIINKGNTSLKYVVTMPITRWRIWLSGLSTTSATNETLKFQFEHGETATSYEPYQGQTYPINLGSLEYCKIGNYSDEFALSTGVQLFDKNNANILNAQITDTPSISTSSSAKTLYIPIVGGTTYTILKIRGSRFRVATTSTVPSTTTSIIDYKKDDYVTNITITTSVNSNYLLVYFYLNGTDTITQQEMIDSIMINEGSTPLPLEPYGIGNWYLKKNIGKYVYNDDLTQNTLSETRVGMLTPALNIQANLSGAALGNRAYCNILTTTTNGNTGCNGTTSGSKIRVYMSSDYVTTYAEMRALCAAKNLTIYYGAETPTGEAITDTTLITQLTNLYNQIKSYKGQTNITQTNAELPFNIDASALYDLNNLISRVATLEVEV